MTSRRLIRERRQRDAVAVDPLQILKLTRQQALRLSTDVGRGKLRAVLERAQADLNQRLVQVEGLAGAGKDSFTARQMRLALRQVEDVLVQTNVGVRGIVVDQGKVAADQATTGLLEYMNAAERKFRGVAQPLPLDEAMMFDRARTGVEASILQRLVANPSDPARLGILQRYGVTTIQHFEEQLQQGVLQGTPWAELRNNLTAQSPFLQQAPAHWAERIVRTETMGAFNRAGWESTRTADAVLGDMVKILSATFDDRTGWDSYQVHGQIRRPQEAFEWGGRKFQHPPNRPNDREVVVPHRLSWPLPAELKWRSDSEVADRWKAEGRKGLPPPRPTMSTVPLFMFAPKAAPQPTYEGLEKKFAPPPLPLPAPAPPPPAPKWTPPAPAEFVLPTAPPIPVAPPPAPVAPPPASAKPGAKPVPAHHAPELVAKKVAEFMAAQPTLTHAEALKLAKLKLSKAAAAAKFAAKKKAAPKDEPLKKLAKETFKEELAAPPKLHAEQVKDLEKKLAELDNKLAGVSPTSPKGEALMDEYMAVENAIDVLVSKAAHSSPKAGTPEAVAAGMPTMKKKSPAEIAKDRAETAKKAAAVEATMDKKAAGAGIGPEWKETDFGTGWRGRVYQHMEELTPRQRMAVKQFSYQYDWLIRQADRGLTTEELIAAEMKHRMVSREAAARKVATAEEASRALTQMFLEQKPTHERAGLKEVMVFRGMKNIKRQVFEKLLTDDTVTMGATSSTSRRVGIASSVASTYYGREDKYSVMLRIKTRSGIAIETHSKFGSEAEILLPPWARFKIVKRSTTEHDQRQLILDLVEIEPDQKVLDRCKAKLAEAERTKKPRRKRAKPAATPVP